MMYMPSYIILLFFQINTSHFLLFSEEARDNGQLFAAEAGCHNRTEVWDPDSVLQCLMAKSSRQLFDAQLSGGSDLTLLCSILILIFSGTFKSRPNIDDFSAYPPLLPNDPNTLLSAGDFYKVPVLIGTNSGEGILNSGDYIKK